MKLLFAIVLLGLCSCSSVRKHEIYDRSSEAQNESLALRGDKAVLYSKRALAGDGGAAYALYIHHSYVSGDLDEANFWLHLASDAGDKQGMYVLGRILYDKGDKRYGLWLIRKAAKKGLSQALDFIQKIEVTRAGPTKAQ